MKVLDLRSLDIQKVEARAFMHHSTSLEEINLNHNLLKDVPRSAIKDLKSLKKLKLGYNQISFLENGTFLGLGNLSFLLLTGNPIARIGSDELCTSALRLRHLFLDNNPLSLGVNLSKCQFIGTLNLAKCSYRKFPIAIIPTAATITIDILMLGYNRLHYLNAIAFRNLNITKSLSLHDNELTVAGVRTEVWKHLTYLKVLDLNENSFETIPRSYFRYLKNLRYLYIAGNNIFGLESGSFSGLPQLNMLDISRNNISALPSGVFKDLVMLKNLRMERNKISHIAKESLLDLPSIRNIRLGQNNLHSLNFWLPTSSVFLTLQRNPIACSCSLLQILNVSLSFSSVCFHQNCSASPIRQLSSDICDSMPLNRSAIEHCSANPGTNTAACTPSSTSCPKSQSPNPQIGRGNLIKLLLISFALFELDY